jgi:hypothetical protein
VSEVDAAVEQLANGYNGHGRFSFLAREGAHQLLLAVL